MINKWVSKRRRILVVLVIAIIVMGFVGVLMNIRLKSLLRTYMERQVTEQARTLADLSSEQFELEIHNLENIARNIMEDENEAESILNLVADDNENISMGILRLDGTTLVGYSLNFSDFNGIQKSFRGHSAVSYKSLVSPPLLSSISF